MGRTSTEIALHIDFNSHYYRNIVRGVARYAAVSGWKFYTHRGIPEITKADLMQWQGAGVIGRITPELEKNLRQRGIPSVNVKADYVDFPVASVLMDNELIGREAARYLIEKGLRRFATTAWSIQGASGQLKVEGFIKALQQYGYDATILATQKEIQQAGKVLQVEKSEPVGFFAAEDFLGRMVMDACEDAGLRIPEDIAVIGVDNSPFICEMLSPTMSSIELGAERVGYQAASLLNRLMQGCAVPDEPIMIAPERIVGRHSTDILEIQDELVARALRFIRDHAAEPITVAEVVDALFCSRRVLEKRFRKEVGRTLHEEIRRSRIERACELLRDSDMLIEVLAEACGYSRRERFNAAFLQETGKTPSAYRKEYRFGKS
ncbi:AraC family transcriptional regulator [Pontiella sulfatireligans]|uniref:Xylose operon regulatory protein n=1 Tax=Pontiella sulfatireligans TaxID=2750658 RepID=A0A6C2UT29_9BACT|nr:DNA-binding transcriptional regulator [Pontiella sulfatireligans]VGO23475.1 Xylose operon regulatory protein [Pontiella sulfatireligans]